MRALTILTRREQTYRRARKDVVRSSANHGPQCIHLLHLASSARTPSPGNARKGRTSHCELEEPLVGTLDMVASGVSQTRDSQSIDSRLEMQ